MARAIGAPAFYIIRIDPLRDGEIFMGDKWQPQEPRGRRGGDVQWIQWEGVVFLVIYGDLIGSFFWFHGGFGCF